MHQHAIHLHYQHTFSVKLSLMPPLSYALPACAWSCCFCLPCHELNHSSSNIQQHLV